MNKTWIIDNINRYWYKKKISIILCILWPISIIYRFIINIRKKYLLYFKIKNFSVPIIVIGNITVGGVGKTPLVISLAKKIKSRGFHVGIVSRGYHSNIRIFPHCVSQYDTASIVGDEALLLFRTTKCPVVIDPNRVTAVEYLLQIYKCQIIISDDGLQHYSMGRSMEIIIIDGDRKLGNGFCLPAGPLREEINRIYKCNFLIVNEGTWNTAYKMQLELGNIININSGMISNIKVLKKPIAVVTAIGNPKRFLDSLYKVGLEFSACYTFPDHYLFKKEELDFPESSVIMTEKDAVKCYPFAKDSWYFIPVRAKLNNTFWKKFWKEFNILSKKYRLNT